MNTGNVLKPCPFCGGKAILIQTSTVSGHVYCSTCDMATHKFWDDPMSEPAEKRRKWNEIAIEAWNRRTMKTPCDLCRYNPPSSRDGKPCTMCVADGRAEDVSR